MGDYILATMQFQMQLEVKDKEKILRHLLWIYFVSFSSFCVSNFIFCSLLSWLQALFKFPLSKVKDFVNIYLSTCLPVYLSSYLPTSVLCPYVHNSTRIHRKMVLYMVLKYRGPVFYLPALIIIFPVILGKGVSPLEKRRMKVRNTRKTCN